MIIDIPGITILRACKKHIKNYAKYTEDDFKDEYIAG